MARLTPQFSAARTVREYTEQHYLPAAAAFQLRTANNGALGSQIVERRHRLAQKWAAIHFGEVKVQTMGAQHLFDVQVILADVEPGAVQVEIFADGLNGDIPMHQEMTHLGQLDGVLGGHIYGATVSAARPASDYTPRVVPSFNGVAIPLEDAHIQWQR